MRSSSCARAARGGASARRNQSSSSVPRSVSCSPPAASAAGQIVRHAVASISMRAPTTSSPSGWRRNRENRWRSAVRAASEGCRATTGRPAVRAGGADHGQPGQQQRIDIGQRVQPRAVAPGTLACGIAQPQPGAGGSAWRHLRRVDGRARPRPMPSGAGSMAPAWSNHLGLADPQAVAARLQGGVACRGQQAVPRGEVQRHQRGVDHHTLAWRPAPAPRPPEHITSGHLAVLVAGRDRGRQGQVVDADPFELEAFGDVARQPHQPARRHAAHICSTVRPGLFPALRATPSRPASGRAAPPPTRLSSRPGRWPWGTSGGRSLGFRPAIGASDVAVAVHRRWWCPEARGGALEGGQQWRVAGPAPGRSWRQATISLRMHAALACAKASRSAAGTVSVTPVSSMRSASGQRASARVGWWPPSRPQGLALVEHREAHPR